MSETFWELRESKVKGGLRKEVVASGRGEMASLDCTCNNPFF